MTLFVSPNHHTSTASLAIPGNKSLQTFTALRNGVGMRAAKSSRVTTLTIHFGATRRPRLAVPSQRSRGFTLVELMIVVAIVGILAALALVGFRKYQISASSGEARAMLQNIRGAEDTYKAEQLTYLQCLSGAADLNAVGAYYPRGIGALDSKKMGWGLATPACWLTLAVKPAGPVRFTFAVNAGDPAPGLINAGTLPGIGSAPYPYTGFPTNDPWFVAVAAGDYDGDGILSLMYTSSLVGEVQVAEDTE